MTPSNSTTLSFTLVKELEGGKNVLVELEITKDYDGYFEALVRSWIKRKKGPLNNKKIVVTSGPYRSYGVAYEIEMEVITLDFYSPIRKGFGSLSEEDIEGIIEIL